MSGLARAAALVGAAALFQVSPIVRGQEVTFVASGDPSDPPRIVADFNGWDGGAMTPSGDGRTYTLRVALDPGARIEYLVAYRGRFVLDPGNPLTVPAPAGPPRSELRMPGYSPPAPLAPARARGTIDEIGFTSRRGGRRRVRVYIPAVPFRPAGTLYVHDGDIVFDKLSLPSTLDSLIEQHAMTPAVVVFVDAVDRHEDFEPGSALPDVLTGEIVPEIDRRYPASTTHRALLGLSRSSVGALDACVNGSVAFEACALMAPAVAQRYFDAVLPRSRVMTRFLIEAGTYDVPLVADARALRDELTRRSAPVEYFEAPEGHNHTAFRARLPAVMMSLFPSDRR